MTYYPRDVQISIDGCPVGEGVAGWPPSRPPAARNAVHEAGHAVAAAVLGIPIAYLTVGDGDGICRRQDEFDPEWASVAALWREVVFTLAGSAAEELHGFGPPDWNRPALEVDRESAVDLLVNGSAEWQNMPGGAFAAAYAEALALLSAHLAPLRNVAAALDAERSLDESRLRSLLPSSTRANLRGSVSG